MEVYKLTRKQFIESHGATCNNWTWSWSFVNHQDKFVIFGAWNTEKDGHSVVILRERWKTTDSGKKAAGYKQSREHIRLIEEEEYALKIFWMVHSDEKKDSVGHGPAKIGKFEKELVDRSLQREASLWRAIANQVITDSKILWYKNVK